MTNNTNIIRAMERMNSIMEEMKKLYEEFEAIVAANEIVENEELTDEEMTELIENDYYDWENDLGDEDEDEEEIEIIKIHFDEEEFKLLYELTNDIPYGYVHNTLTNEFIVTVDYDTLYDIKEKLDLQRSYELYENCNRFAAERITDLLNIIYLEQRYTMLYGTDDEE
jgi:hypothetical protein